MLKFIFLTLTIVISLLLQAQPKHAVGYLSDSTLMLLKKGKKNALYSTVHKEIVVPYEKNVHFVELPGTDLLFRFEEDTFSIFLTENYEVDDITPQYEEEFRSQRFQIGMLEEGIYWVNYSSPPKFGEYFDRLEVSKQGVQKSGVYSYLDEKWIIPPRYLNVIGFNDHFICRKRDSISIGADFTRSVDKHFTYDIYAFDEETQSMTLYKEKMQEFDALVIQNILKVDTLTRLEEQNNFVAWRGGKAGYVRYEMPFQEFVSLDDGSIHSSMEAKPTWFEKELDFDYDFIGASDQFNYVIAYDQQGADSSLILFEKDEQGHLHFKRAASKQLLVDQEWQVDHSFWIDGNYVKADEAEPPYEEMGFSDAVFGIKSIKGNELIFVNSVFDAVAIQTFDEYGEVMVNADGDMVYEVEVIDEQKSGVFDLSQHDWMVPPEYHDIIKLNNGWALGKYQQPEYFTSRLLYPKYETVTKDLKLIEPNLFLEDLFIDSSFIVNDLPIRNLVKVFAAPSSDASWLDDVTSKYYLKFKNGDLGFYEADPYHPEGYSIEKSPGFIFLNRQEDLRFELVGNDFQLVIQEDTISSALAGWLRINTFGRALHAEQFECFYHLSYLNASGDTVVKTNIPIVHDFPLFEQKDYTYEVLSQEDRMIVNEQSEMEEFVYDLWGNSEEITIDLKGAAIWERDSSGWTKMSPYFGWINPAGNGYLIKTAGSSGMPKMDRMEGEFVYDDNFEIERERVIESRYILFDNELKALHFLDHYDFEDAMDLGFGWALKTSNQWMFVSYDLQPITSDEWDDFEKVDDQLKAIKLRNAYDEFGNILFDEKGNPIDPVEEEKFFQLPK